ncbi:MAG: hypothetical protein N2645_02725 [Clostridia bacterium]|nr:hypothetical protein [Clostridia bacterium]
MFALKRVKLGCFLVMCMIFMQFLPVNVHAENVMKDLGTLGGSSSYAHSVNERGQIVGYSFVSGDQTHAFLSENGTMKGLGTLGGSSSYADSINENGQIVGASALTGDTLSHAFLWENGAMKDLGTLGGSSSAAYGINDKGQIVGTSDLAQDGQKHAFLWENGTMKDLGTLGGNTSAAYGINGKGQVVGTSELTQNGQKHAFLWENGTMKDLGTLGGSTSTAYGINDKGQVVGASLTTGDSRLHAFLWENGVMKDLGTLGGNSSYANSINENGQIVGSSFVSGDEPAHGFLWENGVMKDLGTLGGTHSFANGINDKGQIAGASYSAGNTAFRGFLYENNTTNVYKLSGYIKPDVTSDNKSLSANIRVEIPELHLAALTDSNGYFEIGNVPASPSSGYSILISKEDYLTRPVSNFVMTGNRQIGTATAPVELWAGDISVNGVQDDAINMNDIMAIVQVFNSVSGDAVFNAHCDMNKDNAINMSDIVIVVNHFNKSPTDYPAIAPVTYAGPAFRGEADTRAAAAEWAVGTSYKVGDLVTYKKVTYKCLMPHTSNDTWAPDTTPTLWEQVDNGSSTTWSACTRYNVGDVEYYNGAKYKCLMTHVAFPLWTPDTMPVLWKMTDGGNTAVVYPANGAKDELKMTLTTISQTDTNFKYRLVIENPNSSYVWNGTCFVISSFQFETTSQVKAYNAGGNFTPVVNGEVVSVDLKWDSVFTYGKKVEVYIEGTKAGSKPIPTNFKPNYLRGDIIYPQYAGLPASWKKNKPDLTAADLIANPDEYYKKDVGPVQDKFIVYKPVHPTQLIIGQTKAVKAVVNGVQDKVRIYIPTRLMALGLGAAYEMYKINPNYMVALGTKENFAAGIVPEDVGITANPLVVDGQKYNWGMIAHVDGPYQQETYNFWNCRYYFPDFLVADANHDDYTSITCDPEDTHWISAGISSALSLTVTRESIFGAPGCNFNEFITKAADPWAEMKILTYGYNRGINALWGTKVCSPANRAEALASTDLCATYNLYGFANHVPTVKAICEAINNDTSDRYDAQISWADMDTTLKKIRMFYGNGVPTDDKWNVAENDVHRAFNILAQHWGGNTISVRYDYLTLLRVLQHYLPTPKMPRPTGNYWYYDTIQSKP